MSDDVKDTKTPRQRIIDCLNYQRGDWFTASDMVSVLNASGITDARPILNEMAEEGILRIDQRKSVTIYTRAYPKNPLNNRRLATYVPPVSTKQSHINPWVRGVWMYEWQR